MHSKQETRKVLACSFFEMAKSVNSGLQTVPITATNVELSRKAIDSALTHSLSTLTCCVRDDPAERLAFDADVNRSYVGGLERLEENPTVDVLDRLATTLEVSISDFFKQPRKGASPRKPMRAEGQAPSSLAELNRKERS
jgi:transcriptional regulator with XRE-family HTH domain